MRAIRAVIPSAQFLQTEDLGKVFSTRPLRYQAAYENERRWLSLDMLSGRVEPGHRFHDELLCSGISQCQLEELASGEATPSSEEHTSELQSLMRISYADFCLKKKTSVSTQKKT